MKAIVEKEQKFIFGTQFVISVLHKKILNIFREIMEFIRGVFFDIL